MKTNEWRLGNLLQINHNGVVEYWKVSGLDDENGLKIKLFNSNTTPIYDGNYKHEPIPLTEELLLKCWFKKSSGQSFEIILNDWTKLYYNCGYFEISINGHAFSLNHIKYLHQLQNLYFVLTQQELEINL